MNAKTVSNAWERFWFAPTSTATIAVVRIFFGFACTLWTLSLIPTLSDLLSNHGVMPKRPFEGHGVWTIFDISGSDAVLIGAVIVLLIASVCLMIGFGTRIAAVVVFVGMVSFQRRNLLAFAGGDLLMRTEAFYLMFAPAGAALSLDRWRRDREHFWEFPKRAPWALRLIQIQLSVVYLSTVWDKVQGTTWNNGTAVSYALRISDLERFPVPTVLSHSPLLSNLLTFGTLATELSLGILIWNRVMRPYVIAAGLGMHTFIEYHIRVGWFWPGIVTGYLAFAPPEKAEAFVLGARDRLAARRERRRSMPATAMAAMAVDDGSTSTA